MKSAAGVLCCCAWSLACSVEVASGLDEQQAAQWLTELEQAGVDASRERDSHGSFAVRIATRDTSRAIHSILQGRWECPAPPVSAPLLPSLADERAARARGIAHDLERDLRTLPGVLLVKVHLSVAEPAPWTPHGLHTAPTASVLLEHAGPHPPLASAQLAALVAGAVPELRPESVQVVTRAVTEPETRVPPLERVGPMTLTRSSANLARGTLVAGLGLVLGSAGVMLVLWWRSRKLAQELAQYVSDAAPSASSRAREVPRDVV